MLKTMFILRGGDTNKDVTLEMAEEILQYPRASSRAQFKPLKHVVDGNEFGPWVNQYDIYAM